MSQELRVQILVLLEEHSDAGSNQYKSDVDLASEIGVPVEQVQKQLDILESEGLIQSANSYGSNSAIISPKGSLAVEQIREQLSQPDKSPMGFRPESQNKRDQDLA